MKSKLIYCNSLFLPPLSSTTFLSPHKQCHSQDFRNTEVMHLSPARGDVKELFLSFFLLHLLTRHFLI